MMPVTAVTGSPTATAAKPLPFSASNQFSALYRKNVTLLVSQKPFRF